MGRGPVVSVEGAKQLRRTLRQAGDDFSDLKAAHADAAEIAARAAKPITPVLTGRLRDTIRSSGTKTAGIIRAGKAAVPYANPIHWGWPNHNITGNPFLSDGAQKSEKTWIKIYEDAVEQIIEKVEGMRK